MNKSKLFNSKNSATLYLVLFLTQTTISESRNLQLKIPQIAKKISLF